MIFKMIVFVASFCLSMLSHAALFENLSYSSSDPAFMKSFVLDTGACESKGYLVKFYGSSKDYKFCEGLVESSRREYKKCVGREVGGYPLGKRCLGYRKTVVETTKIVVTVLDDKWTRTETLHRDSLLIHQEVYAMTVNDDQIELETSFVNNDWNGTGEAFYLFVKSEL